MPKPVVALDIDEVLCPIVEAWLDSDRPAHYRHLRLQDFTTFDIAAVLNVTRSELAVWTVQMINAYSDVLPPVKGAHDALQQLSEHYRFEVITARPKGTEEVTQAWLDNQFPGIISRLHFVYLDDHPSIPAATAHKVDICRQIHAKYLIDDQILNYGPYIASGIVPILFGKYPWNEAPSKELPPEVKRARDWEDVQGMLAVKQSA